MQLLICKLTASFGWRGAALIQKCALFTLETPSHLNLCECRNKVIFSLPFRQKSQIKMVFTFHFYLIPLILFRKFKLKHNISTIMIHGRNIAYTKLCLILL